MELWVQGAGAQHLHAHAIARVLSEEERIVIFPGKVHSKSCCGREGRLELDGDAVLQEMQSCLRSALFVCWFFLSLC